MKFHSIKFKITFLYTCIVTLLFCLVLGCSYAASRYYSENSIKKELIDEIHDFRRLLLAHPDYLENTDQMTFFDDHILISIYDEKMHYIDGILPDEFPKGIVFKDNIIQTFHDKEMSLFIYDTKLTITNNEDIWIRGVHTFNALSILFQRLIQVSMVLLPLLIIITALLGYRMINRSLHPVHMITTTVNEIINSSDLSMRLEKPTAEDELYALTETFNQLLQHLQQQFLLEQQFTSDAAHELRTPVSSILSRCEYCLEELEASDEMREELLAICQKAHHMSGLISNLLAIARAENQRYQPTFEEVDLGILAEAVIEELSEKASAKNITLKLQNEVASPVVFADMEMMMRLFVNLINNAISYGKEHGYVHVIFTSCEDLIIIEFVDNGIGIPKQHLEHIWNRFYQVDSSRSSDSFGLGLFMVKYIVDCHKGEITVTSTEGEGSVFTVILKTTLC